MNREKLLVKNTVIIALGTFIPQFVSIITLPIITGGLTKIEYGTYDLINTLITLLLPVLTLQMEAAAFRFLIDKRGDEEATRIIISTILTFVILIPILPLVILIFSLRNLSLVTRCLIGVYFYFDVLVLTLQQIVRGIDKNKRYSESAIIRSFVRMVFIVLTIKNYKMGLNGLLMSMSLSNIVSCLILFSGGRIGQYYKLKNFSKEELYKLLVYSLPMIPNCICLWVMNLSDRLLITSFLGVEMVAIYAVANKIPNLFALVQSTFTYAWQENASMTSKDSDSSKYYSNVFDTVFCILVGTMALLIASTPIIYALLIRGDYQAAYNQMPILFLGIFFSTLNSFFGGIYVAFKKTKEVGITTMIGALLNFCINILLISLIGLYAASLSTVISFLILVIYRMYGIQKFQTLKYNLKKIIICIITLCVMSIVCFQQNILLNIINIFLGVLVAIVLNKRLLIKIYYQFRKNK